MCTAEATFDFRPFALLAGEHGIAINAGTAARWDSARVEDYCRALDHAIEAGELDPRRLYVLRKDLVRGFNERAGAAAVCVRIDDHDVCAARETLIAWQDEFDVMFTVLPSLEELLAFHIVLEAEYRDGLRRAERTVGAPPAERVTMMMRYLWYRRGGCSAEDAAEKVFEHGDRLLRMCGDPFHGRMRASADEAFAFRQRLEAAYRRRPASEMRTTYVDPEGEAVWLFDYVAERLSGRDATAARELVLARIRAAAGAS
jgi:hypothetical protein